MPGVYLVTSSDNVEHLVVAPTANAARNLVRHLDPTREVVRAIEAPVGLILAKHAELGAWFTPDRLPR